MFVINMEDNFCFHFLRFFHFAIFLLRLCTLYKYLAYNHLAKVCFALQSGTLSGFRLSMSRPTTLRVRWEDDGGICRMQLALLYKICYTPLQPFHFMNLLADLFVQQCQISLSLREGSLYSPLFFSSSFFSSIISPSLVILRKNKTFCLKTI